MQEAESRAPGHCVPLIPLICDFLKDAEIACDCPLEGQHAYTGIPDLPPVLGAQAWSPELGVIVLEGQAWSPELGVIVLEGQAWSLELGMIVFTA